MGVADEEIDDLLDIDGDAPAGPAGRRPLLAPRCPAPNCPDCGKVRSMTFRIGPYGFYWQCMNFNQPRPCPGRVAARRDGSLKGTPADQATRQARIRAHAAFDPLWQAAPSHKRRGGERRKMYRWLQDAMALSAHECHIAKFNVAQCERVIELVSIRQRAGSA